jgi:high-affinity nickel-transport protein
MSPVLSLLLLSLLIGVRHAADPDHIVAVTTIVARERSVLRAAVAGVAWGAGHTCTVLLVGGLIILFRLTVPPRLGLALEFLVALMLIGLGALTLAASHRHPRPSTLRPLLVGVVHGLAGSAAVALLVLATIPDPRWAIAYLLVFSLGTVTGMAGTAVVIAAPARAAATRFGGAPRALRLASGALSLAFGLFLAHRVGIVDGLFTASPSWTPR